MTSRFGKVPRARAVALAVGVGVLSSFAFAGTSLAAAPASGTACQAADGKISGRGATFQTKAQQALITGYTTDVCGPVATQYAGDPAGSDMVVYNYAGAANGSGQGQKATSCRTDAFGGTDIPYTQATLAELWGAPGSITGGCDITFTPPFTPSPQAAAPRYPNPADIAKPVMSFPVAGGAVAVGVNLLASATCATPPTALQFSTLTMSKLIGGEYSNWNAPDLVTDNPSLSSCSTPITRVVRFDKSGTTQTFKNYLKNADGARTLCDGVFSPDTWTTLAQDANNTSWPTGGTCVAPLQRPTVNGGAAVVSLVGSTDGAVGYADLADWSGSTAIQASLRDQANTAFVAPSNGAQSNCTFPGATLPGSTNGDAVGLNAGTPKKNWATDAPVIKSDLTYQSTGYPICGLTWDFVYTALNNGAVANPITGLTANQRRTLYSYFTYVFSPAAQSRLPAAGYDSLPAAWLLKLRQGFQAGF